MSAFTHLANHDLSYRMKEVAEAAIISKYHDALSASENTNRTFPTCGLYIFTRTEPRYGLLLTRDENGWRVKKVLQNYQFGDLESALAAMDRSI